MRDACWSCLMLPFPPVLSTLTLQPHLFPDSQLCSAPQMFGTVPVVIFQILSPLFIFRSAAFDLHFLTFSLSPYSSILTIVFTLQLFPLLFAISQVFPSQPASFLPLQNIMTLAVCLSRSSYGSLTVNICKVFDHSPAIFDRR